MTDSEDDLLESFQYSIRNEGTIIHAKGPNINFETISLPSSTMQILPGNDNRPKHGRINYDQRSLFYRRETSPMSTYNVSHFSRPYYRRLSARSHIGSQHSVYSRGNRSPASIRSLDSTASVTASDIVVALKNEHFSKYDQKLLKAACYKFLKNKSRKRLEYMRNRRILMSKVRRQRSTEDLGEMASESSSSSENRISPKIFKPKETYKVVKTNNVNQVCIRNNYSNVLTSNHNQIVNEEIMPQTTVAETKQQECTNNKENPCLLKDRFKKGFLLPAQRFSKSANGRLSEDSLSGNLNKNQVPDVIRSNERDLTKNVGSDDEIFSSTKNDKAPEMSITKTRKRTSDSIEPENNPKAPKLMKTNMTETENINNVKSNTKNDFNFARPQMPITKFGKLKKKKIQPEILISKSSQPLSMVQETVENILSPISKQPQGTKESDITDLDKRSSINNESVNTINDVSKRPSFIKRKLFTQKVDVFENKIDNNISQNSPQANKYVSGKEKTKPRKLATSQSCLSRDVLTEDNNNLLNLLNKIVPADQMSIIKPTNKTDTVNRNSDGAKWDIDSILSTCNPDDGSETYTDEDILGNEKNSNSKCNTKPQCNATSKEVDEMPQIYNTNTEQSGRNGLKDANKNVKANQKSFWDTDIESDWENNVFLPYKLNDTKNRATANQRVNKINCDNDKSIAVSTSKQINTKLPNVDANKNVTNQKSIWDTDFESDLETYGILPPKTGVCKEINVVTNKNSNNKENCQNNKIIPVNCKSKTISNSTKCQKVEENKISAGNCQKSIWDTDFESDLESCGILPQAKKLASCKVTTTNDRKVNNEDHCQNKTNGAIESRTKSVINSISQNVDVNKKTSNNCRKSIWENYNSLRNRSANYKTNNTTAVPDKNGSNKGNCKSNASIAVNSAVTSVAVVKCQRLEDMKISNGHQKFVSQLEPESCKNNATAYKRVNKNQETVKADSNALIKTRQQATKTTPNKVVSGKDKNAKQVQKNNSPEPDHNVSERWLRANRRSKTLSQSKAKDSLRTVSTLISHRMTRQMMKKLHNSDITATSKQPNESTELNITNRSLRPRKKRVYKEDLI